MSTSVAGWAPRLVALYRPALTVAHLPSIIVWGMVARLHLSATLIALLLVAVQATGSYAQAGTVTAALVLGQGVVGPWRGRAVDRRPAARLLVVTSMVYGVGLCVLAVIPPTSWLVLAAVALVVGLALPPSTQVARAKVAQLVSGPLRRSAYSLQVTGNEVVLAVGPPLVAVAAAIWSARVGLLACAFAVAAGGALLARAVRRAGVNLPPDAGLDAPVGARRRIGAKAWAIVGALTALISAFAVIDLTLIAWGYARGTPALGGALIAVWAVGSVAGGLVIAARHQRETRLGWRLLLVTAGIGMLALTLPPVVSDRPWVVAVVLLIGGAVIPAAVAAGYDRLTDVVPANRRAEIFGWLGTATTAGTAAAGPVAGATFEHYGPAAAVAIAAVAAAVATALATGR